MTKGLRMAAAASIIFTVSTIIMPAQSTPHDHWVATWATSEQMAVTTPDRPVLPPNIKMPDFRHMKGAHRPPGIPTISPNQTVRMIVHTSIPGQKLRIELSNAFDKGVVTVGDAHVAIRT